VPCSRYLEPTLVISLCPVASVLVLGVDPEAMPGLDATALRRGLERELVRFGEYELDTSMTLVKLDETAEPAIVAC
jgi:hypothetical protein